MEVTILALWLVAGALLAILFAYDLKWSLLPNRAMFPLVGVSALIAVLHLINAPNLLESIVSLVVAGVILSGLYLALWYVSKGRWIGYGDIKLGLALALLLGDWPLAFIALFAANFIGCLVVIPGLLSGRMTRQTHVPFGPLLIAGGVIAMLFGQIIIQWYMNILI
jgi:prepilin signal peptidase PulO-like enzyme (type II secretory pathway)